MNRRHFLWGLVASVWASVSAKPWRASTASPLTYPIEDVLVEYTQVGDVIFCESIATGIRKPALDISAFPLHS